jgi:hypothetical protein
VLRNLEKPSLLFWRVQRSEVRRYALLLGTRRNQVRQVYKLRQTPLQKSRANMITWPFVGLIAVLTLGTLGCLWLLFQNNCDMREHEDRLKELEDEIAGIVR